MKSEIELFKTQGKGKEPLRMRTTSYSVGKSYNGLQKRWVYYARGIGSAKGYNRMGLTEEEYGAGR